MKKSSVLTSILLFTGALVVLLSSLVLGRTYKLPYVLFDVIPEFVLGILLICFGCYHKDFSLRKARTIWLILFAVCAVSSVIVLADEVTFLTKLNRLDSEEIDGFLEEYFATPLYKISSWLDYLPFARILSNFYAVVTRVLQANMLVSLSGHVMVFIAFLYMSISLSNAVKNGACEPQDVAGTINETNIAGSTDEHNTFDAAGTSVTINTTDTSDTTDTKKIMSFGQSIKTCFKKYLSFKGCATRAEFWWFYLFITLGSLILFIPFAIGMAENNIDLAFFFLVLTMLFELIVVPPFFAVRVRRMHDVGYMGIFIAIPIVNFIFTLMPSDASSKYKNEEMVHPVANVFGYIFFVSFYILYAAYCLVAGYKLHDNLALYNATFRSLSNSSWYDDYDEDYDYDYEEDSDYDYHNWWEEEEE